MIDKLDAVRPVGLTWNAWALRAGVSRTIFNDIRRRDNIRHDTLQKLLSAIDVSLAGFERAEPDAEDGARPRPPSEEPRAAWSSASARPVPVLRSAFGGDFDSIEGVDLTEVGGGTLDWIPRPPALGGDREAYAVRIVSDSMAPRFEPGELALVSPTATVAAGDDVIACLAEPGPDSAVPSLVKRLVGQSSRAVTLQQFNPALTFEVEARRVLHLHRVIGRL